METNINLIFDPILQRKDLFALIFLYRTSREYKEWIDRNIDEIGKTFGIVGMKNFKNVVEAHEKTIAELPIDLALPRSAKYSLNLFNRVIDTRPEPILELQEDEYSKDMYEHFVYDYKVINKEHDGSAYPNINFYVKVDTREDPNMLHPDLIYDNDNYTIRYYQGLIQTISDAIQTKNKQILKIAVKKFSSMVNIINFMLEDEDLYQDTVKDKNMLISLAKETGVPEIIDTVITINGW